MVTALAETAGWDRIKEWAAEEAMGTAGRGLGGAVAVGRAGLMVRAAMAEMGTMEVRGAKEETAAMAAEGERAATVIMVALVAGAAAVIRAAWAEMEAMASMDKPGAMAATDMLDKGVRMRLVKYLFGTIDYLIF